MTAITDLDKALATINAARETYGANTNRLQHALNAVDAGVEDQAAAESRIRDVDMANQMSELTRQQIMTQGSTEALRTAQGYPQLVLRLLQ
jgi:flagellin